MKPITLLIFICMLSIASSCGQTTDKTSPQQKINDKKVSTNPKKVIPAGEYLKLTKHEIMDREGTGMVAFTCLVPEGWTVRDKLYWEYNDATLPIRYQGTFENSKNKMLIKSYPDTRAVYSNGPTGTSGYPPPRGAIPGLKEMIRRERNGIQYRISHEKLISNPPPQTQYVQGMPVETHTQSGVVRIEYSENNQVMEEEFYGQLDISNSVSQGVVTLYSTIWAATNLYSVKAPKGKLDDCRKIAMTIKASSRATLPFYNKFIQVTKLLSDAVYARIYQAGQISKIISQTNDQISKSISDSYWQTQKTYDRTNTQFSDAMRGVDRYNDGSQILVQLPSGYDNAWVNDRGEYLMSMSNGFDPNTTLTGNWKQLERK
jgi:hypothetical protein